MSSFPIVLAPLLLLASAPLAQQFKSELQVNDQIAGRPVRELRRAVIDDDGSWSEVVLLDQIGTFLHKALIRDGNLILAEGQFLPLAGARLSFLGVLEGAGDNAAQSVILDLFNPPRSYSSAEAILHRGAILLTDGEPVNVVGLPSTTLCREIGHKAANGKGTVLSVARVDGVPPPSQVLLRFEFDPNGVPLSRELLLSSHDVLLDGTIAWTFTDAEVDELGNWMVGVRTQDRQERLVTRNRIVIGSGDPSPIPGRSIVAFLGRYDRNDFGGYAVHVSLDGDPDTNVVLIKNGMVLYQEGETLPSLSPDVPDRTLAGIGQVRLSNAGNVYWHALPGSSLAHGFFLRDRTPFLQVGVSEIEGEVVGEFLGGFDTFDISPSGRFWVGRVQLATSGGTLVVADFGASRVLPGCAQNPGTLRHTEGLVLAGQTIRLVLDGPARPGSIATLSLSGAAAGSPCGQPSPFGEILIDPARLAFTLVAGVFAGGSVAVDLAIPANLALVNREFFAQGAFLRPGALLTNGLSLEVGAP